MFNEEFKITARNKDMLYVKMAIKNVDFAVISLNFILDTESIEQKVYEDNHTFYFYYIQNFLAACGNINNIFNNHFFNPIRIKTDTARGISPRERSKELRQLCGVNLKEFPLIFQRQARNTNMHFDERYDEFNSRIGDYNILDENTPADERFKILHTPHLRTYDKQAQEYITVGSHGDIIRFPLRQLRQELIVLKDKLTKIVIKYAD